MKARSRYEHCPVKAQSQSYNEPRSDEPVNISVSSSASIRRRNSSTKHCGPVRYVPLAFAVLTTCCRQFNYIKMRVKRPGTITLSLNMEGYLQVSVALSISSDQLVTIKAPRENAFQGWESPQQFTRNGHILQALTTEPEELIDSLVLMMETCTSCWRPG